MNVVDSSDDASMDEIYVSYVDDEHADNHDYDDTSDDDHDNNNDIYVSGPDPGRTRTGPGPDPGRTGRCHGTFARHQ